MLVPLVILLGNDAKSAILASLPKTKTEQKNLLG